MVGSVEVCGSGSLVDVRVWDEGKVVGAASVEAPRLAGALSAVVNVDDILFVFPVETLVEHLKRRLQRLLESARKRYLETRRFILTGDPARALLEGKGNGFTIRLVYEVLRRQLAPLAHQLVILYRLLLGLEEWLEVYESLGRRQPSDHDIDDLAELLADADDVAGVPGDDTSLLRLLEEIRARLNGIACSGYECVEAHPEAVQAVLAG